MASNGGLRDLVADLRKARALFRDGEFSHAVVIFDQIANSCSCGVPTRRPRCRCKSLIPAINNDALDAELRKKCTCSGKSDVRCRNGAHIDALDGISAVQEIKGNVDLAIGIAESMINLDPREPRGFLRLGKLLRVRDSYLTAYKTYQQGIELVSKKNPSHPLLAKLREFQSKVKYPALARDPLPILPLELVGMIFQQVDFRTLCLCLCVSKSWKRLLTTGDETIQALWRNHDFSNGNKSMNPHHARKYAAYSGSLVKRLSITDNHSTGSLRWLRFALTAPEYRNIEVLRLLRLRSSKDISTMPYLPQLTDLCIEYEHRLPAMMTPRLDYNLISMSAKTLRELTIWNMHMVGELPVLENLRSLRICASVPRMNIDLARLLRATPNVENVWLEKLNVFTNEPDYTPWRKIKRICLGPGMIWGLATNRVFRLTAELELLHVLDYPSARALIEFMAWGERRAPPHAPSLHHLAIRVGKVFDTYPKYITEWVQPGLESGSLQSLELPLCKPLPKWFKSPNVKFLAVSGISMNCGNDSYEIDRQFLELLDRFPNLEAVDIAREPINDATLAKAIKRGIKTIYHRGLYYGRDELENWAREYKVKIIYGDYANDLDLKKLP